MSALELERQDTSHKSFGGSGPSYLWRVVAAEEREVATQDREVLGDPPRCRLTNAPTFVLPLFTALPCSQPTTIASAQSSLISYFYESAHLIKLLET